MNIGKAKLIDRPAASAAAPLFRAVTTGSKKYWTFNIIHGSLYSYQQRSTMEFAQDLGTAVLYSICLFVASLIIAFLD